MWCIVEGADAAGEGHEGVAVGDEVFLALGEGADADELADGLRVDDVVAEEGGDDAHHAAALLQGRAARDAHQSQIATTVEQRVAAAGDGAAELPRGLGDLFAVRERRPAED